MPSDPKVPADLRHSSPEPQPRAFSMQLIESRWRPAGLTPVSAHETDNLCMGKTSLYPNISSFLPPSELKKYKSLAFIAKRKDMALIVFGQTPADRGIKAVQAGHGRSLLQFGYCRQSVIFRRDSMIIFVCYSLVFLYFFCCFFIKRLFLMVILSKGSRIGLLAWPC